jgi:bacterioferritin (cytochrome b1)
MVNSASETLKALRTAIEIEENGLITFLKFARQTKQETGKNMFIRLAMDEHEHRLILEKQLSRLLEGKTWEDIEIPKSEIELVAPTIRDKQQRTREQSTLGETDALNTALDLERKAADFFRQQAELASEPQAKALFRRLAEWEDTHYDLIQAEFDYINQTGFWFNVPEFRMDGKY